MKAYKVIVKGCVQGVGFRYYTRLQANTLPVCGTVENLDDGSVLIHVQGEADLVHDFIKWCHKGPPSASVLELEYSPVNSKAFTSFEILR